MEPLLEPLRRLLMCTALALCTANTAQGLAFTLLPADTSVGPGDAVVLRLVSDAAPDIRGCSLECGYTAARLTFVSAQALGRGEEHVPMTPRRSPRAAFPFSTTSLTSHSPDRSMEVAP